MDLLSEGEVGGFCREDKYSICIYCTKLQDFTFASQVGFVFLLVRVETEM